MRVRTPRPSGGCHQCWTSPSRNWRAAERSSCSRKQRRLGVHQRHRVLQLVAEAERAARLIEAAAAPHAAGEHLVEQPAVGQEVERGVGRLHVDRAERAAPVAPDALQRRARRPGAAEALHERACVGAVPPRAEGEDDLAAPGRRPSSSGDLHRQARIEARADAAREPRARQARGLRPGSVAARGTRAVAGDRALALAAVEERDPRRELAVVRVAREQRAGLRVDLGDDVGRVASRGWSPSTSSQTAGDRQAGAPARSGCASLSTTNFTGASVAT